MISAEDAIRLMKLYAPYLEHNGALIDIFEGNLLPHILSDMKCQLSQQQFKQASFRCAPINVLPKIIDKLTNIYQTSVIREVVDGTDSDKELLSWYQEQFEINEVLNSANEMFNLCKATLIHPYVNGDRPRLRVIMNDLSVLSSSDRVEPTRPTDVIIGAGKKDVRDRYWVFGEEGFMAVLSDGSIDMDEMIMLNNPAGINPIAPKLPFVYTADSKYKLMPVQDTDVLPLTKVIPIMLTDLNLAAMYQAFSILFGIDVDEQNMELGPGIFLRFKSDPTTQNKPEIGTIKPTVDYPQVLQLIQAQFSMWLQSKGIRPGAVGELSPEAFASGISKIIDEMDTYEARQKQVTKFTKLESELWDLVLNYMHPYWVREGLVSNRTLWSPGAKVKTTFAVQLPMQSRGVLVKDLKEEYAAGFTTRKRAIQKLNPQLTSDQIEELIAEIDEERSMRMEEAQQNMADQNNNQNQDQEDSQDDNSED